MHHSMSKLVLMGAAILLSVGCAREQQSISSWKEEVVRELDAAYERFREAYRTADADMVAQIYMDSAFYLQPGRDIVQGRDTIYAEFHRFLGRFAEDQMPGPDIRFDIVDRDVSGDLAYDIGYFTLNGTARGKFIVIWKRDAQGIWRMYADGYSDAPDLASQ